MPAPTVDSDFEVSLSLFHTHHTQWFYSSHLPSPLTYTRIHTHCLHVHPVPVMTSSERWVVNSGVRIWKTWVVRCDIWKSSHYLVFDALLPSFLFFLQQQLVSSSSTIMMMMIFFYYFSSGECRQSLCVCVCVFVSVQGKKWPSKRLWNVCVCVPLYESGATLSHQSPVQTAAFEPETSMSLLVEHVTHSFISQPLLMTTSWPILHQNQVILDSWRDSESQQMCGRKRGGKMIFSTTNIHPKTIDSQAFVEVVVMCWYIRDSYHSQLWWVYEEIELSSYRLSVYYSCLAITDLRWTCCRMYALTFYMASDSPVKSLNLFLVHQVIRLSPQTIGLSLVQEVCGWVLLFSPHHKCINLSHIFTQK